MIGTVGAIAVDGVTLKMVVVTTMILVRPKSFRDEAKIGMETKTIALFESPKVPNAENLRSSIDERLQSIFGSSLATMQRSWTVVTDGASVMA